MKVVKVMAELSLEAEKIEEETQKTITFRLADTGRLQKKEIEKM